MLVCCVVVDPNRPVDAGCCVVVGVPKRDGLAADVDPKRPPVDGLAVAVGVAVEPKPPKPPVLEVVPNRLFVAVLCAPVLEPNRPPVVVVDVGVLPNRPPVVAGLEPNRPPVVDDAVEPKRPVPLVATGVVDVPLEPNKPTPVLGAPNPEICCGCLRLAL